MSILAEISENLQRGKAKVVKQLVQQAIDDLRYTLQEKSYEACAAELIPDEEGESL